MMSQLRAKSELSITSFNAEGTSCSGCAKDRVAKPLRQPDPTSATTLGGRKWESKVNMP